MSDHVSVGGVGWSPDYKTERDMGLPQPVNMRYVFDADEKRILDLVRSLRPGQELRVVRDELGGRPEYRVYDVTEDPV